MKLRKGSIIFWICLSVLVIFVLWWGLMAGLGVKQRRDKAAVQAYIVRVQPVLSADPRFKDVRLAGYSCDSVMLPYLPIFGTVRSQEDWESLNNLIQVSHPPVAATVRSVSISPEHKAPQFP
jgi:hypothetical protein